MIYISEDVVKEMFRYHPVDNPERAEAHDRLNLAAQAFAVEVFKAAREMHDSCLIEELINEIQTIRMLCNTYITYVDINKKRKKEISDRFLTAALEDANMSK